jgi:hypothetical protein
MGKTMSMKKLAAVIVLALLACKQSSKKDEQSATAPAANAAAAAPASATTAPPSAPTDTYDAVKTKKTTGEFDVILGPWKRSGKTAYVTCVVVNNSDSEQPLSTLMSFQLTTVDGLEGKVNIMAGTCDGTIPPHGKRTCGLAYDFTSVPEEVQFRVAPAIGAEGVWFRMKLADGKAAAAAK